MLPAVNLDVHFLCSASPDFFCVEAIIGWGQHTEVVDVCVVNLIHAEGWLQEVGDALEAAPGSWV